MLWRPRGDVVYAFTVRLENHHVGSPSRFKQSERTSRHSYLDTVNAFVEMLERVRRKSSLTICTFERHERPEASPDERRNASLASMLMCSPLMPKPRLTSHLI